MTSQQMNINTKIEMIKKKNQMEILEVKSTIMGKRSLKRPNVGFKLSDCQKKEWANMKIKP